MSYHQEQINLARDLVKRARHIAMATVNQNGSPHNTPLVFIYNPTFTKVYWGSHPNSVHSANIKRDSRIFMVLFDVFQHGKGGLYITGNNASEVVGDELEEALEIYNSLRLKWGKKALPIEYYSEGDQKMYSADIIKLEVYNAVRDGNGHIKEESRAEIKAKDLIVENWGDL